MQLISNDSRSIINNVLKCISLMFPPVVGGVSEANTINTQRLPSSEPGFPSFFL